ncbi:unnamed protein product [Phyllotreta striolata]|uniref:Uncharacterized protein n=1 Tax=Phyllotreta striolata TaxID=444603 RepID=A0A9N9TNA5_PHYSR|nr:unnamed protein product [Phyllotreta striolata]
MIMGWRDVKGWYRVRSTLEKVLLLTVLFFVFVIIVFFVCLLTSHDLPENDICMSPECIRAAVHILDTIDAEVNPCDDFYRFACGNFLKNAYSNNQPTMLHSLSQLAKNQLRQIVMERRNEANLTRLVALQRRFFRSCTNTSWIDKHGDERLFNILDVVVDGWPILKMENWSQNSYVWTKPMVAARKLGVYHHFFLRIEVMRDFNTGEAMLWIRPPFDAEIESFMFDDANVEYIYNIAKELGASSVDVKTDLRITNKFAEELRSIAGRHSNQSQAYDQNTNITIQDIDHKFLKVDWWKFLRNITGLHLSKNDRVIFDVDGYLSDLYYLFHRTSKSTQANYIAWVLILSNINYLPEKIRNQHDLMVENTEHRKPEKRVDQCYELSLGLFTSIAEAEYIRRYTTPEKKQKIQIMIDYVQAEMKDAIETSKWMDEENRSNAIQRLKNITTYIGWLDAAFNTSQMEEIAGYNKIKHLPRHGHAIDIAMLAIKVKYDKLYASIHSKLSWKLENLLNPGIEVNAYFMRSSNMLILPASILQGVIYDANRPNYMNFGALGSVIGHELTHGFSILQDTNDDVWTNSTLEQRGEIVECVQKEYNRYRYKQGKDTNDSSLSVEENVADFSGVTLAYDAYRNWRRANGGERALPGVRFNGDQIFWIMASTFMCYEPQLAEKDADDQHSTPEFRVIGRIRNSPYFAHDFGCPEGSRMNPREKCRVFV